MSYEPNAIRLAKNQILRLDAIPGCRVVCQAGSLWITQDGDPRDLFVEPGQSLILDRPGLALISAHAGDALVRVVSPPFERLRLALHVPEGAWEFRPEPADPLRRLRDRFARWLAQTHLRWNVPGA